MFRTMTKSILQSIANEVGWGRTERLQDRLITSDLLFYSRARNPKHILQAPTHQYSQNYEDSIISEIFQRIGERSKFFVEVGVYDGVECNSRALLERGWSGVWIDGNTDNITGIKKTFAPFIHSENLKIVEAHVTKDNIETLVSENTKGVDIDFLSIDIDYNTSHAWRSIDTKTRVACIEYNSSCAPIYEWEVPYSPNAQWDNTNFFGASLKTLEKIANQKNMNLVGCDFHGVNAFFVSMDECGDKFLAPYTSETHFEPPRYSMTGHRGHPARR